MKALPLFHIIAGKPVIVLGEGEAAAAKSRLVERAGGFVVGDDNRDAQLAFIALDQPELAATRLKARGVLVNVTDRPELCDFTVPSVLDRDPVLVAVGTGGVSAGLAKHVRLRLETLVPAGIGKLAEALNAARDLLRARWPDPGERRRAVDRAIAEAWQHDALPGRGEQYDLERLLDVEAPPPATIELKIASDDPDDLTLRQARLLGSADALLIEPGIAPAILNRARADAVRLTLPHDGPIPSGLILVLRRAD
jgi:uroporphyrin-III C-methyltransferase/precorrin-2 dehydrogenase/sirohydrochlorin ferrochelatase